MLHPSFGRNPDFYFRPAMECLPNDCARGAEHILRKNRDRFRCPNKCGMLHLFARDSDESGQLRQRENHPSPMGHPVENVGHQLIGVFVREWGEVIAIGIAILCQCSCDPAKNPETAIAAVALQCDTEGRRTEWVPALLVGELSNLRRSEEHTSEL